MVKLSIFTPTHNTEFLDEAYDSLKIQDYEDWEWVIVPSGKKIDPIPPRIMKDKRVRMAEGIDSTKIGAIKLHCCRQCKGDAFIELDHDDLLVPGILTKIAAAIEAGAGFVYSDSAVFNDGSLDSWAYSPSHGWESYDLRVYEKPFKVTKCFDLTPRSLCEVYYAPDHVRVWSREAYEAVGGHDPTLAVADDHDLICRTYISGAAFHYLDCCGYLYRYHRHNTVKKRSEDIQKLQGANRQKYMNELSHEWARRNGLESVEFGPTIRNKEWAGGSSLPHRNDSVGHLVVGDCLQYLRPEHQVPFWNEAYRVLAPSGILHVSVPSTDGLYADMDPRHLTRFNSNSFAYYTVSQFAATNPEIACKFQEVQKYVSYPREHYKQLNMKMLFADLCALKGQRQPAPQGI